MSFQDKVVLVTGASSGIGAAIAEKFVAERAKVAIIGRNTTKLADVSKRCEQLGLKPHVIVTDITKEESARKAVSETIEKFGKLDILINNAGAGSFTSILADNAIENYDFTMNTNLRGVVCFTHFAAPHIIKTKGNIINISSTAALRIPTLYANSYCASKAGLDHFTRSVALELALQGIRVNTISPGPVRTDILSNTLGVDKIKQEKMWDNAGKTTALGRVSDTEEIADLTLFVASDKARGITGSTYVIDNGFLLMGLRKSLE